MQLHCILRPHPYHEIQIDLSCLTDRVQVEALPENLYLTKSRNHSYWNQAHQLADPASGVFVIMRSIRMLWIRSLPMSQCQPRQLVINIHPGGRATKQAITTPIPLVRQIMRALEDLRRRKGQRPRSKSHEREFSKLLVPSNQPNGR